MFKKFIVFPLLFILMGSAVLYASCPTDKEYETWLNNEYQISSISFSYNGKISEGLEATTDTGLWLYKRTELVDQGIKIEAIGLLGIFIPIETKGV